MERLQEWGAQLIAVFSDTFASLVTYLPVVLTAIAVLLIGWLLAILIRGLVRRALESMDWLFARLMPRSAGRSETLTRATSRAISTVVFWIVLLVFAASALRILGGSLFERWTENLLAYLPSAIGGVIIIVIGFTGGTLARHILEQASVGLGVGQSSLLGRLAQAVIVISCVVIGIDQLGVNVNFLIQLTTVTAAAVFGGIALVFALGTRQHLANLIGAHYARKHYAPGDYVKIGAFQGRIVEIADGCVFIETERRRRLGARARTSAPSRSSRSGRRRERPRAARRRVSARCIPRAPRACSSRCRSTRRTPCSNAVDVATAAPVVGHMLPTCAARCIERQPPADSALLLERLGSQESVAVLRHLPNEHARERARARSARNGSWRSSCC